MNGARLRPRPRAISDHVLIKWSPEAPSAAWCCIPTPSETPPHLKKVICNHRKQFTHLSSASVDK